MIFVNVPSEEIIKVKEQVCKVLGEGSECV